MTRLLGLGAVALVAMTAAPASAAFLVIDDFSVPSGTLEFRPNGIPATAGATQSNVALGPTTNIIGGVREQTFTVNSNGNGNPTKVGTASATIDGFSGILDVANSPRVDTTDILRYDGTNGPGGSLGANLVVIGGQPVGSEFQVAVSFLDLTLSITVRVTDTNNNSGFLTRTINGPIAGPPDTIVSFQFNNAGYAGVDFTSIASIQFEFSSANTAADYQVSVLGVYGQAVPEPASLGLAAAGLVAVGGFARRKFAKKA